LCGRATDQSIVETTDPRCPHPAYRRQQMPDRWRITDVARYLGVSRQRAQQLAHADRLPRRAGEDRIGPYWRPSDVRRWANTWAKERPWRHLGVPD
jgi:hypothetical protein